MAVPYEKLWSYFYGRIPMLCILDLVSTEQITHCDMAVIWPRRNIVEIRSTEGCRAEIQCTLKALDQRDHFKSEKHRGSMIYRRL